MTDNLFPTTVIGSLPRPAWVRDVVLDRKQGRISEEEADRLLDRAIEGAIVLHERGGLDEITCGERRRESREHGRLCSVCGEPVTIGVLHRVEELADRPEGGRPERVHKCRNFIPLPEILGELNGTGSGSQAVDRNSRKLLSELGPELSIPEHVPLADLERIGGPTFRDAIDRMRSGRVHVEAGYDGVYGTIRVFQPGEREAKRKKGQKQLF